ncbi:hypothetical protein BACOV975_03632 [Bacteroides ovatus V975]|nr:hypothetical protein BACOV975_03632 [Bacteroides ovatus V975]
MLNAKDKEKMENRVRKDLIISLLCCIYVYYPI